MSQLLPVIIGLLSGASVTPSLFVSIILLLLTLVKLKSKHFYVAFNSTTFGQS